MTSVVSLLPPAVRGFGRAADGARPSIFTGAGIALAALLALAVYSPPIALLSEVFQGSTTELVRETFGARGVASATRNTVVVVGISGVFAMLVGTVFAWLKERTDADLGIIGAILPLAPLLVPKVAMAIGFVFLASPQAGYVNVAIRSAASTFGLSISNGPINIYSWYGLIFVYTLQLIPFSYLVMAAGFRNLDSSLEEASRVGGAGAAHTFFRVTLPSLKPSISASAFLITVVGVATYSIPVIIGTGAQMEFLPVRILHLLRNTFPAKTGEAAVLSVLLLAIIGLAWLLQIWLSRGARYAVVGGKASSVSRVKLGRYRGLARWSVVSFLLLTSVLPLLALVAVSLQKVWTPDLAFNSFTVQEYRELLTEGGPIAASLKNSIQLSAIAATIATLVGFVILTVARRRGGTIRRFIEWTTRAPSVLSNVVLSVAFLTFFGPAPFYLAGTTTILILAYAVLHFPTGSVVIEAGLQQIGGGVEEASAMAGASRWQTFSRILLPLNVVALATAWIFFFVSGVGDLAASAMMASTRTPVVGFLILDIWENGTFSELAVLAAVTSVLTGTVVLAALALSRRYGSWPRRVRAKPSASVGQGVRP